MENSQIKTHTISDIIEILGEKSQHEGFHIHTSKNRYSEIPFSYPFRSDTFTILVVVSGKIKLQLNLFNHDIHRNEAITIVSNSVYQVLEMSPELEIIGISFTSDFLLKNTFNKSDMDALNFLLAKNNSKLLLKKKEVYRFKGVAKFLQEKTKETSFYKDEIILHLFNFMFYELASIYKKQITSLSTSLSRQEDLTVRFFKLLEENFKKERVVQFYADRLYVTSGHLSKVLKKVSGKTASQLIEDVVTLEARILLGNTSLSIAQIAEELQFSDQSFFGKYFKKKTGVSPSAYRNNLV